MKKIVVFGGSLSKNSINKQLAVYASELLDNVTIQAINLYDFGVPTYNIDTEKEQGIPNAALAFIDVFQNADGIICSTSEHNASITAALKSILDWCSRKNIHFFNQLPTLLLSTSPGGYGGQNARKTAELLFPKFSAQIVSTFSLPKFQENFSAGKITNNTYLQELALAVTAFQNALNN